VSDEARGTPVHDPDRVIADAREEIFGDLMDAVRLHCVWLRQLESRLQELGGLDHEVMRCRDGRAALMRRADACLTTTDRIEVGDL
jgi:hypothetical protein